MDRTDGDLGFYLLKFDNYQVYNNKEGEIWNLDLSIGNTRKCHEFS